MRALFMGQRGIDKKRHLDALRTLSTARGSRVDSVFHVGDLMYEESRKAGRDIREGKILDLPLADLAILRRLAFTCICTRASAEENIFVNSHAVFRWNNQLFRAFELSELRELAPDVIITLVDDVDAIKLRLDQEKAAEIIPTEISYSLKDLLVWREEEILASDILGSLLEVPHYVLGVSLEPEVTPEPMDVAFSLLFEPWKRKAYVSYPISEAQRVPEVWEKVVRFRRLVRRYLAAFDPLMIDEKRLQEAMARRRAQEPDAVDMVVDVRGEEVRLPLREIEDAIPDIDGQIIARDYKLVDQADMIVAYFPSRPDGTPLIAGGVQSEVEHAAAATREVVVFWESLRSPTPFIGQRVDRMVTSLEELEDFLREVGAPRGQLQMPLDGAG